MIRLDESQTLNRHGVTPTSPPTTPWRLSVFLHTPPPSGGKKSNTLTHSATSSQTPKPSCTDHKECWRHRAPEVIERLDALFKAAGLERAMFELSYFRRTRRRL